MHIKRNPKCAKHQRIINSNIVKLQLEKTSSNKLM